MSIGTELQYGAWGAGVLGFFLASGSLWLGVVNYRHLKSAPAVQEQRAERNELRELLLAARFDLEKSSKTLDFGDDFPSQPPTSFKTLRDAIPRYKQILEVPTAKSLDQVEKMVGYSEMIWDAVESRIKDATRERPMHNDPAGRKRAAVERDAMKIFDNSVLIINSVIDTINSANRS